MIDLKVYKWLRRIVLITFIFITAWFGFRLLFFTNSVGGEASSLRQFNLKITDAQLFGNSSIKVTLKFKNPSEMDIKISYIFCEVRIINERVGMYTSDLTPTPMMIAKFSEYSREFLFSNTKFQEYKGEKINIQVYGMVKIGIFYFNGIAVEDNYTITITG